jgi:sugar lactone lactonase YvrE
MMSPLYKRLLFGFLFPLAAGPLQASAMSPTTTTFIIAPGSSVNAGSIVTLTAIVTNPAVVTEGQIKFCDATTSNCDDGVGLLASAQLTNSGSATAHLRPGVGTHNIKAVFPGASANMGSTSTTQVLSVVPNGGYASTTTLVASGIPANYTLSGTITSFGSQPLTGTVRLLDTTSGDVQAGLTTLDRSSWIFSRPTSLSIPSGSQSVTVADFNGDGQLDMAVANEVNGTVSVIMGNGDGTFRPQTAFAAGSGAHSVIVGDFNGDGRADLAVADQGSSTVSVLLGNGDGTFQAKSSYATGTGPLSVALGDFNGDGRLDLAVANEYSFTVSVLLGNGDGTFQAQSSYATGTNPWSVAVGDFNGDGKLDLAIANEASNSVSVLLGNGDGTFRAQTEYAAGLASEAVAVGDFNGDGKADLAVANYISGTISVLLGNGDGTFQAHSDYPAGLNASSIVVGDFNNDGKPDLATVNYNFGTVSVLAGNGDGTFQTRSAYTVGTQPVSIAAGDFNGDGIEDLTVSGLVQYVLLGEQTASYSASGIAILGNGVHNVLASYSGDGSRESSQSSVVALTAITLPSHITLTSSPASLLVGQTAVITAKVEAGATGTVSFVVAGKTTVVNVDGTGAAQLANQFLGMSAGSYPITASYSGDAAYTPATANYSETISAESTVGVDMPSQAALVFLPAQITTIVGTGVAGETGDGANGISAQISHAFATALDPSGNVYISDTGNNRVRKLTASTGLITPFAGTGVAGYSNDGEVASIARLDEPGSVFVDQSGNVYLADQGNSCVRKVDKETNVIATVAGVCVEAGYSGDGGTATSAVLNHPSGVVVDALGNLYISDSGNFCIRKVTVGSNIISTVAGICTVDGYSGDGGPATGALMSQPKSIALDQVGNLYIADTSNNRIRKIDSGSGDISTLVGTGVAGFGGDGGPATSSTLNAPAGIAFDGHGDLYIADTGNNVIRMVTSASLIISTVAGSGTAGFTGDGSSATTALLSGPTGVTVSPSGTLYITDQGGNAIRIVGPSGVLAFPSQDISATNAPQIVTIANHGNRPLIFSSSPVVTGDFSIGPDNTCGVATLDPGASCTLTVSFLPTGVGTRTGTIQFSDNGDPTDQFLLLTGNAAMGSSWITLATSKNPSTYGSSVDLTARVTPGATGIVTFKDGATIIGTGTVSSSVASLSIPTLTTGTHSITAVYGGDNNYSASTSPVLVEAVERTAATISVESSNNLSMYGDDISIIATVTPGATGTVTFTDGSALLGIATLNSVGRASISTSALGAGAHSITATYSGDQNYY